MTARSGAAASAGAALRAAVLAAAAFLGQGEAAAQTAGEIIVVDIARVRADSELARALAEIEAEARRGLRLELDAIRESLEAEEAELTRLRDTLDREAFEARVRRFDDEVRASRRRAQEAAAQLQERFAAAHRAFDAKIGPVLEQLMRDIGASVAFDRAAVLSVASGRDATAELIARLDAAAPASEARALVPPRAPLSRPVPPP